MNLPTQNQYNTNNSQYEKESIDKDIEHITSIIAEKTSGGTDKKDGGVANVSIQIHDGIRDEIFTVEDSITANSEPTPTKDSTADEPCGHPLNEETNKESANTAKPGVPTNGRATSSVEEAAVNCESFADPQYHQRGDEAKVENGMACEVAVLPLQQPQEPKHQFEQGAF